MKTSRGASDREFITLATPCWPVSQHDGLCHVGLGLFDERDGIVDKPAWMRWRTFERLIANYDAFICESLAGQPFSQ